MIMHGMHNVIYMTVSSTITRDNILHDTAIFILPLQGLYQGGTKLFIFHMTFVHTNVCHRRCVPIQLIC